MLKINFIAETGNDDFTPINIASALIQVEMGNCRDEKMHQAGIDNLSEIADHLNAYIRRQRYKSQEIF